MSQATSSPQDPKPTGGPAVRILEENEELRARILGLEEANRLLEGKRQSLEDENSVLLNRISELTVKLAAATQSNVQQQLELELRRLRARLAQHAKDKYGSSSERRGRPDGSPPKDKKDKKDKKKRDRSGPSPQPDLPKDEQLHLLEPADCCCPKCGGDLRAMARQFEESERIVAVERRFKVVKDKRQKYHCRGCGHIEAALGPTKLIPGGRYDLSFVIQVALDKYLCHLPLERQVKRMRRCGLVVTRQTLWDQLHALYVLLLPTLLALHEQVLQAPLVHVDETGWRMMGKGSSKKWWLWSVCCAEAAYYALEPSRGSAVARHLLRDYDGLVVADGYTVYRNLEKARTRAGGEQVNLLTAQQEPMPDYSLVICWMHARRPLFKAEANCPEAKVALDLIAALYAVEAEAVKEAEGDLERLLAKRAWLRETKSRDIVEQLRTWRDQQRPLPKSYLAKGVTFLKNQWDGLTRFLENPLIPLDNGEAERSMRGPVLGRKNFYGCRSERGARVAAAMYSVLESCKRAKVDPQAYLTYVAQHALENPKQTVAILPTEYAKLMESSAG